MVDKTTLHNANVAVKKEIRNKVPNSQKRITIELVNNQFIQIIKLFEHPLL